MPSSTATPPRQHPRDGRVLVVGGFRATAPASSRAELYDRGDRPRWTPTGGHRVRRARIHVAATFCVARADLVAAAACSFRDWAPELRADIRRRSGTRIAFVRNTRDAVERDPDSATARVAHRPAANPFGTSRPLRLSSTTRPRAMAFDRPVDSDCWDAVASCAGRERAPQPRAGTRGRRERRTPPPPLDSCFTAEPDSEVFRLRCCRTASVHKVTRNSISDYALRRFRPCPASQDRSSA